MRNGTLYECIKVNLLKNLVNTSIIQVLDDASELTDIIVKSWCNGILNKKLPNLGNCVTQIIKTHTHNPDSGYLNGTIQEYVFVVMTDFQAKGGSQIMKHKSHAKSLIMRLADVLNRNEMKDLLFRDKSMWNEGVHPSIYHFLSPAGEIAT